MGIPEKVSLSSIELKTRYGAVTIQDPLAQELILSEPFQRLKSIHQYGVVQFIKPIEEYSRFDHSIGVYLLLQKNGVSRNEQIAGLLHDVSHTVFSHVGDYVFKEHYPGGSYQDDIHIWYLKECGIDAILAKHGIETEQIFHVRPEFQALDQPLPYLCADRIEYNLQGGLLRGLLTQEDFFAIYEDLAFEEGSWHLKNVSLAEKLGNCSLVMTETLWGSAWEALAYRYTAEALRRAFEIELITFHEFHFSSDDIVWGKLVSSPEPLIADRVGRMKRIESCFNLTEPGKGDLTLKLKFRGIDPVVKLPEGRFSLTQLSDSYRKEYERVKAVMERGWHLTFESATP